MTDRMMAEKWNTNNSCSAIQEHRIFFIFSTISFVQHVILRWGRTRALSDNKVSPRHWQATSCYQLLVLLLIIHTHQPPPALLSLTR